MEVVLKKQPEKHMDKCTQNDYDKIDDALDGLQTLMAISSSFQGVKMNTD